MTVVDIDRPLRVTRLISPQVSATLSGLRAIAALMVVAFHIPTIIQVHDPQLAITQPQLYSVLQTFAPVWQFGQSGVILFFILSGFLLGLPFVRALMGLQSFPPLRDFYIRRALRILPAYYSAIVILVVVFRVEYSRLDLFFLHPFMLHTWNLSTVFSINPVFWTMAIESQFYLILPLAAWAINRWGLGHPVRLWTGAILLFCSWPIMAGLVAYNSTHGFLGNHMTLLWIVGYLPTFGIGIGIAFLYVRFIELGTLGHVVHTARWAALCGVLCLCAVVGMSIFTLPLWDRSVFLHWLLCAPLVSVGYGALLFAALVLRSRPQRWLALRPLVFIGTISYSLYIWHSPLLTYVIVPFLGQFHSGVVLICGVVALTCLVIIPFSAIYYACIERPFMRLRVGRS